MIGLSKIQLINLDPIKEIVKQKLIEQYDATTFMNTTEISMRLDIKDILAQFVASRNIPEPIIYITSEANEKMRALVDLTDTEIGWYGIVHPVDGLSRQYIIEDIVVYPQTVTGATCEQADDKMFDFEMSLTDEQVNNKRFHGHSHVNMGTTPSGVDEAFYQDILTQVPDYFIVLVTNKKGQDTVRFYDIENNILYTDLELNVILDNGTRLIDWYTTAVENLEDRKPLISTASNFKGSVIDDDYWDQMMFDEDFGYITRWEKETKVSKKKGKEKWKRN